MECWSIVPVGQVSQGFDFGCKIQHIIPVQYNQIILGTVLCDVLGYNPQNRCNQFILCVCTLIVTGIPNRIHYILCSFSHLLNSEIRKIIAMTRRINNRIKRLIQMGDNTHHHDQLIT